MNNFKSLNLNDEILQALSNMGFSEPTPVQQEVIPLMLKGKDVLAQAPTGTGKTCAFGIPIVNMAGAGNDITALVLCPTRELARQIEEEIKRIAANSGKFGILAVYGGQNIQRQFMGLKKRPRVIVGTPGRIIDHLNRKTLSLQGIRTVVLDEADEMLNMGFRDDIDYILSKCNKDAQTVMFSATIPNDIMMISRNYQHDPHFIKTQLNRSELPVIRQFYLKLKEGNKLKAFQHMMRERDYKFVLCFCNTKRKVDLVASQMNRANILALGLHGDMRQSQRDSVMRAFRNHEINVLIATDVAARGIDVDDVEAVVNYDLPADNDFYIHRIGRTARANKTGESLSFASFSDYHRIAELEKHLQLSIEEYVIEGITEENLVSKNQVEFSMPSVRYSINIGAKDGAEEDDIRALISEGNPMREKTIINVQLGELKSFVEIEKYSADYLTTLNGKQFNGRVIAVERHSAPQSGSLSRSGKSYGSGEKKGIGVAGRPGVGRQSARPGVKGRDKSGIAGTSRSAFEKDTNPRGQERREGRRSGAKAATNEQSAQGASSDASRGRRAPRWSFDRPLDTYRGKKKSSNRRTD